jgi:hypothetical protein
VIKEKNTVLERHRRSLMEGLFTSVWMSFLQEVKIALRKYEPWNRPIDKTKRGSRLADTGTGYAD